MKKLLLTVAAIPMALGATQAAAQVNGYANADVRVQQRIANLESRYNAGVQAGAFSNAERSALHRQLVDLRSLERRYSYNGISENERRSLQQRIREVREQLRNAGGTDWARRYDWNERDDAYANGYGTAVTYDAYGRPVQSGVVYDQYGRAVPGNGVVYDQYGRALPGNGVVYDQYGRPVANGYGQSGPYYGQGGPYEPVQQRSGVGNVVGNVLGNMVGGGGGVVGSVLGSMVGGGSGVGGLLGNILGQGGLRTGDVITGTIGSVLGSAMGFGQRYRDTNSVYYRSDGQRVYEIDARTNRVVRIHPVAR